MVEHGCGQQDRTHLALQVPWLQTSHSLKWQLTDEVLSGYPMPHITFDKKLKTDVIDLYYIMARVCSQDNTHSDWLILRHYSPIMPTGQLWACKTRVKSHIINNLLIWNAWYSQKNPKPWPCFIDLAITWKILQGLSLRFFHYDLTFG